MAEHIKITSVEAVAWFNWLGVKFSEKHHGFGRCQGVEVYLCPFFCLIQKGVLLYINLTYFKCKMTNNCVKTGNCP